MSRSFLSTIEVAGENRFRVKVLGHHIPNNQKILLAQVAKVYYSTGTNTIDREHVSRFIVVSSNVTERDLDLIIKDIRRQISNEIYLIHTERCTLNYSILAV